MEKIMAERMTFELLLQEAKEIDRIIIAEYRTEMKRRLFHPIRFWREHKNDMVWLNRKMGIGM